MQTVQIQISWLLQKPTDLDLHCLQRQDISGFSRTRVNMLLCRSQLQIIGVSIKISFSYFSMKYVLDTTHFVTVLWILVGVLSFIEDINILSLIFMS